MSKSERRSARIEEAQREKGKDKGKSRAMLPPETTATRSSTTLMAGSLASLSSGSLPGAFSFRDRPQITPTSVLPSFPGRVFLHHPAINRQFLSFPSYDQIPGSPVQYGIHHETVLTACKIVAGNRSGYLISDRHHDDTRIPLSQLFLPSGIYYYRVDGSENDENYPIHRSFRTWKFPHRALPRSWSQVSPPNTPTQPWPASPRKASICTKLRDNKCFVTESKEYLQCAHIVPEAEQNWLVRNNMDSYLEIGSGPLHRSPFNLFSLRGDFRNGGFDQARFTIIPKNGKFVVHFLKLNSENATLYHNTIFDHNNTVSHEALYARFAWTLFYIINERGLDAAFNYFEPEDERGARGEGKTSNKRKRDDSEVEDDGSRGQGETTRRTRKRGQPTSGSKNPALPLQPDNWLSDVVYKMAPPETQSSLEADVREIEEDMGSVAPHLPFLVDSSISPSDCHYHNLPWYPGMKVVQRRKQAYLDAHPNISASSGPFMQDDGEMSDNE